MTFTESLGTAGNDTITGSPGVAQFGLGGMNHFIGSNNQSPTSFDNDPSANPDDDPDMFVGGNGSNVYDFTTDFSINLSYSYYATLGDYGAGGTDEIKIGHNFSDLFFERITMTASDGSGTGLEGLAINDSNFRTVLFVSDAWNIENWYFNGVMMTASQLNSSLSGLSPISLGTRWGSSHSTSFGVTDIGIASDESLLFSRNLQLLGLDTSPPPPPTTTGTDGDDTLSATDNGDTISGGGGNDTITGGAGGDNLGGGAGNDTVSGGSGNDSLRGGQGNDTVTGGAGNDSIQGGQDNDTVNGGSGSDTVKGSKGDDSVRGGADNDTVRGGQGNDTVKGDKGDDNVQGDLGNDTVRGGQGNDTVQGGDGTDSVNGDDGNDSVNGNDGNDTVNGGAGNDTVVGGNGADTVNGGTGNDSLSGGDEADRFVFDADSGQDTISDFQKSNDIFTTDVIDVSGAGLTAQQALDATTESGGNSVIDLGNGNTITVTGVTGLTAGDFIGN